MDRHDDIHAIETLIYHYADLIDAGRFEDVARLFANACVVSPDGEECAGEGPVLALYQKTARIYPDTGTPCTEHMTTNVSVQLSDEGDTASATSRFTVLQAREDFPLQVIIAGQYRDRFRKREGRWEFERREMYPRLIGDLSHHLMVPLSP